MKLAIGEWRMAIALRKGNVVLNKTRKYPMKMFMFLDSKTEKQYFLLYSFDFILVGK